MYIVIIIALSLAFAVICVAMARRKHRSELLWGLLGFFFGPVAVIILALKGSVS